MSQIEVFIIVEGQTEQTFIREVLAPEIAHRRIYLRAALIGKPGHKGGDIRFERAKTDIGDFLKQRSNTYVSTMFDYFRIDSHWPGQKKVSEQIEKGTTLSAIEKAKILEDSTKKSIQKSFKEHRTESRFIPYIGMHEFEALLFSDADILAQGLGVEAKKISEILDEYNTPEEINDHPEKAPSKQIEKLNPAYRKIAMGKVIAESIGIQTIRKQCPHFNDWLTTLENLSVRTDC